MGNEKFIVQTPKTVIDQGKLALIFGLFFTVPVLIFTAIFGTWNTSAKVLALGLLLTGTGIVILLTHRTPRLEVYGSHLRVVGPGKREYSFSIDQVGRALRSPSGGRVLFDRQGQVLLRLSPGMENLNLLDQYLFGKD
jgi:hypothetical protein